MLSELLVYPTPTQKKRSSSNQCARVLTSAESLALLEEKEQIKKDQQEQKIRRKKEREEKKLAREKEKQHKLQERAMRQKVAKEKARAKAAEKATAKGRKRKPSSVPSCSQKRRKVKVKDSDRREVHADNECAVCCGQYQDVTGNRVDDSEWIQCTNSDCAVWTHVDCLEQCDDEYICAFCQTYFV